ncbi:unnamed protein product, partial [Allacma fusca]
MPKQRKLKSSPVSNIPRRSRHRLLKQVKQGGCSGDAINFILESPLTINHREDAIPNETTSNDVNGGGHALCEDWLANRQSQGPNEHFSSLNRQEKILLINAYVIKHGLTKSATEDLLTLLQLLSPEDR